MTNPAKADQNVEILPTDVERWTPDQVQWIREQLALKVASMEAMQNPDKSSDSSEDWNPRRPHHRPRRLGEVVEEFTSFRKSTSSEKPSSQKDGESDQTLPTPVSNPSLPSSKTTGSDVPASVQESVIGWLLGEPGCEMPTVPPEWTKGAPDQPGPDRIARAMLCSMKSRQQCSKPGADSERLQEAIKIFGDRIWKNADERKLEMVRGFVRRYFVPNGGDPKTAAMFLNDWMDDLREFPPFAVRWAFMDFRQNHQDQKPSVMAIRKSAAFACRNSMRLLSKAGVDSGTQDDW